MLCPRVFDKRCRNGRPCFRFMRPLAGGTMCICAHELSNRQTHFCDEVCQSSQSSLNAPILILHFHSIVRDPRHFPSSQNIAPHNHWTGVGTISGQSMCTPDVYPVHHCPYRQRQCCRAEKKTDNEPYPRIDPWVNATI